MHNGPLDGLKDTETILHGKAAPQRSGQHSPRASYQVRSILTAFTMQRRTESHNPARPVPVDRTRQACRSLLPPGAKCSGHACSRLPALGTAGRRDKCGAAVTGPPRPPAAAAPYKYTCRPSVKATENRRTPSHQRRSAGTGTRRPAPESPPPAPEAELPGSHGYQTPGRHLQLQRLSYRGATATRHQDAASSCRG